MTDIFNEIEEDLRKDKAKELWKKYGNYVIALAVLIVLGVAGWRGFQWYQEEQANAAGVRFEQALQLARDGKTEEAEKAFAALGSDAPKGYRLLSRFRTAAETAKRDPAAGIEAFKALASDNGIGPLLQDLAKVRAAMIEVDTKPFTDILAALEPLAAPNGAWRHSAREILGISAFKAKDFDAATKWFSAAMADPDVPSALRQRAEVMMQLIAADAPPKPKS